MLAELREDLRRLAEIKGRSPARALLDGLLLENGFQAVLLYRIAHRLRSWGIPFLGPFLTRLAVFVTGAEISPAADIGPGLYVGHGVGLVVGGGARIGRRAFLLHQVTIGSPSQSRLGEMPVLGDDVFVGAGAKILGAVSIGDGAFIGAGAIVTRDVPAGYRVAAAGGVEIRPPGSGHRRGDQEGGGATAAAPGEGAGT